MAKRQARLASLLRAMTGHLPQAASAEYDIRPPNRSRTIFRGPFTLSHGRRSSRCHGSVRLAWVPDPVVRFQARLISGGDVELGDGRTLRMPGAGMARASITGGTWVFRRKARGDIHGPLRIGQDRPVRAIRIHVANFHDYVGAPARFQGGGGGSVRLDLDHGDWRIQLDQRPDYGRIKDLLRIHGGYGIGHVGILSRSDGSRSTRADAEDVLSAHCGRTRSHSR